MTDFTELFERAKTEQTLEIMVRGRCRKMKVSCNLSDYTYATLANYYREDAFASVRCMLQAAADRLTEIREEASAAARREALAKDLAKLSGAKS